MLYFIIAVEFFMIISRVLNVEICDFYSVTAVNIMIIELLP